MRVNHVIARLKTAMSSNIAGERPIESNFLRSRKELAMNSLTRRTMFQRGGMLGGILALDTVSPALARTTPAGSSVRFKAIDAALRGGVSRNDVAGVIAVAATPKGMVYEGAF